MTSSHFQTKKGKFAPLQFSITLLVLFSICPGATQIADLVSVPSNTAPQALEIANHRWSAASLNHAHPAKPAAARPLNAEVYTLRSCHDHKKRPRL